MNRIEQLYQMLDSAIERAEQDLQALRALHDDWKKEDASPPPDDEEAPCEVVWLTREEAAQWVGVSTTTVGKYGADGILPRRKNQDGRWIYALPIHRYAFQAPPKGHSWQIVYDAAKHLKTSTSTVQKHARNGKILRETSWFGQYIYAVLCEQTPPPSKIEDGFLNL